MIINKKNDFSTNQSALNYMAWLSFFWAFATVMVVSILPAFVVDELKVDHAKVGLIEGIAISSSFLAKFFSGIFSDITHSRKPLIVLGTFLSIATKTLFALSTGAYSIFTAKLIDRFSKGIRSAPADALVADLSKKTHYASNFAFRQTLCSCGAIFASLVTIAIMLISNNNYRLVFWLSLIPAIAALALLVFVIKPHPNTHPRNNADYRGKKFNFNYKDFSKFSLEFWWLLFAFFFLMMARFSETFLTLQAKNVGFSPAFLPVMIIIMDLAHAVIAIPSGKLADKENRKKMLSYGMTVIFIAQITIFYSSSIFGFIIGIILVGLHMGITQGLLKALIAQSTPAELRGTAFSLFFIISGFAIFLGNVIAGKLSHLYGTHMSFLAGALFSFIAIFLLNYKPKISLKISANNSKGT